MKGAALALVVGVVLAVVSIYLMNQYVSGVENRQVSQPFLRLKSEEGLSRGQIISTDSLEVVRLPEAFANLRQIAVPNSPESVALLRRGDTRATRDVPPGSFLLFEHIVPMPDQNFASQIGEGMRALSVPVTAISSVSYFVGPGSRVDILVTVTETGSPYDLPDSTDATEPSIGPQVGEQRRATKTLLQNVAVMAVGRSVSPGNYLDTAGGYSTVTFEVTPVQAELLTFAMSETDSGLSLVLRNPANTEEQEIPAVNWDDLR